MRKLLFLFLCTLAVSSCTSVQLPDARVCAVAGVLAGGMDCARTLSPEVDSMTLNQTIEFLEPTDTRGAALCMSADDFGKLKSALEIACEKLGRACSKEVQESLKSVTGRVSRLQSRVIAKRRVKKGETK